MLDRWTKFALTLIALAFITAVLPSTSLPSQVAAGVIAEKDIENIGKPIMTAPVPRSWGRLVAVVPSGGSIGSVVSWLYFEAPDGTVRVLHSGCGAGCDIARTTYPRK